MGNNNSSTLLSCAGATPKKKRHSSLPSRPATRHQDDTVEVNDSTKDISACGGEDLKESTTLLDVQKDGSTPALVESADINTSGTLKASSTDLLTSCTTELHSKTNGFLTSAKPVDIKLASLERSGLEEEEDGGGIPYVDEEGDVNDMLSDINSISITDSQLTESLSERRGSELAQSLAPPSKVITVLPAKHHRNASNTSDKSTGDLDSHCNKFRSSESLASTNEELQATLQELGDLQRNVNQLAEENEQLGAERMVLLESLCTQTDKLENARTQIEHLKALILSDTEHTQTEREQELVNLLKIATEEREEFLLKQCEIHNALESFDQEYKDMQERVISLNDKCKHLEDKRQGAIDEKVKLETQASDLVEELANERIELERYKTLLENEKGKVLELQQLHKAEDKSELEQLVENTRADKEKLEQKCTNLQESLAHSRRELAKTKEQMQNLEGERCNAKERADYLEQELVSARNNNKTCISDLEFKYDKISADRGQLETQLVEVRKDLEAQRKENNRLIEENKNVRIEVSDLQAELKGAKHRYIEFEKEMEALSQRHEEEASDWKQFQSDLQTAVVIANAIKAEAVEEKELLVEKNRELSRKNEDLQKQSNLLQAELDRVKAQKGLTVLPTSEIKKHILGSDRELVALRQGRRTSDIKGNQNIVSVKSLIKTIEGQGSLGSSTGSSRRGSSDSLNSPTNTSISFSNHMEANSRNSPERRTNNHNNNNENIPLRSALKKPKDAEDKSTSSRTRGKMFEKTNSPVIESLRPVSSENSVSSLLSIRNETEHSEKSYDPLAKLVKQTGGSKRNALLKWCQQKSKGYREVDITNFSSSWNDGLAFCALLHSYIPNLVNYEELIKNHDKRENFSVAFQAAESVGVPSELDVEEMVSIERPDWQMVMSYVTSLYQHFEGD